MTITLVDYAEIKAFLDLEEALESAYPALEVIHDDVTYAFEAYLARELESIARTQVITVYQKTDMIILPAVPVASVSSFEDMYGNTYTEASEQFVRTQYGLRMLGYTFQDNELSVTYTGGITSAGYISDTKMKGVFQRAALRQIAYEYQSKDFVGASSVSTEGGSVQRPALSLLAHVRKLIDVYRHPMRIGRG